MGIEFDQFLPLRQKVTVTVWLPGDNDQSETFVSYVKDVQLGAKQYFLDIPPVQVNPVVDLLHSGMIVGISADNDRNGQLVAYGKILSITQTGISGIWIEIEEKYQSSVSQRRAHVRVFLDCPIEVQFQTRSTGETVSINGRLYNFSAGGALFASTEVFQPKQLLQIRVKPPAKLAIADLILTAEVIRSVENPNRFASLKEQMMTSVFFKNVTAQQEQQLVKLCFQQELRLRSKSDD